MDMIGQRLFTGRVAVAQAALAFAEKLFADTKRYSDAKMCVMRGDTPALTDVPQLRALYEEAEGRLTRVKNFVETCESRLCECLAADRIPPAALTRAIAVAKIRAVETAIELCFRLKQEVGSYALMDGTGFQHCDFLQCCKFAEETRASSPKNSPATPLPSGTEPEENLRATGPARRCKRAKMSPPRFETRRRGARGRRRRGMLRGGTSTRSPMPSAKES